MFNYFESEALKPYPEMLIEESSLPRAAIESDFAVDSSGFSTSRFVQWMNAKYTDRKLMESRDRITIHLMCGVKTNIVTAVTITDRFASDNPQFKLLVEARAKNFVMQEVSADQPYLPAAIWKGSWTTSPCLTFRSRVTACPIGRTEEAATGGSQEKRHEEKERPMASHESLLSIQSLVVHAAIPSGVKRRIKLFNDQGKVR